MSRNLTLLPFEGFKESQFSHSILRLCGFSGGWLCCELHNKLEDLTTKAEENKQFVPNHFSTYISMENDESGCEDAHYGVTKRNSYGDPLVYIFVRDLLELEELHKEYYKYDGDFSIDKEKALGTMAYIKTLPENRRIALYWD